MHASLKISEQMASNTVHALAASSQEGKEPGGLQEVHANWFQVPFQTCVTVTCPRHVLIIQASYCLCCMVKSCLLHVLRVVVQIELPLVQPCKPVLHGLEAGNHTAVIDQAKQGIWHTYKKTKLTSPPVHQA